MILGLLSVGAALAQPPVVSLPGPVRVGARMVGEAIRDPHIAQVYDDTHIHGELYLGVALPWQTELTVSGGYKRLEGALVDAQGDATGDTTWFWHAPITAVVKGTLPAGPLTLAGGFGPTAVAWAEQPGVGDAARYQGTKVGLVAETGVTLPLGRPLTEVREAPNGADALEAALLLGYRWTARRRGDECGADAPCGLDLSALRVSFGIQARF